jgi:hypothetical protein
MGRASSKWCLFLLAVGLLVVPLPAAADGPPGSVIAWGCHSEGKTVGCNVPVAAATGVKAIAAGLAHDLALKLDGSVLAWGCFGEDDWGQCTVPAAAASGVTAISAGEFHSLAVKNGGVIALGLQGWQSRRPDRRRAVTCRPRPEAASRPSRPARVTASRCERTAVSSPGAAEAMRMSRNARCLRGQERRDGNRGRSLPEPRAQERPRSRLGLPAPTRAVHRPGRGDEQGHRHRRRPFHNLALKDGVRLRGAAASASMPASARSPAATSGVTAIAAGSSYSLALKNGGVLAWGCRPPSSTESALSRPLRQAP